MLSPASCQRQSPGPCEVTEEVRGIQIFITKGECDKYYKRSTKQNIMKWRDDGEHPFGRLKNACWRNAYSRKWNFEFMVLKFYYHFEEERWIPWYLKCGLWSRYLERGDSFIDSSHSERTSLRFLLVPEGKDKERKGVERRGGRNQKEWNNLSPRTPLHLWCLF